MQTITQTVPQEEAKVNEGIDIIKDNVQLIHIVL